MKYAARKHKTNRTVPALIAALALVILVGLGVLLWLELAVDNIAPSMTVEAGTTLSASDFKLRDLGPEAQFAQDPASLPLNATGEYTVAIRYYGQIFYSTLKVVDTVAPVIVPKDAVLFSAQTPKPEDFIAQIQDATTATVTFVTAPDMSQEGSQAVQLRVTDQGGNVTMATATLTVKVDHVAPTLQGVQDLTVCIGVPVDFFKNVTATDDQDPAPKITLAETGINLTVPGQYSLVYYATDLGGNSVTQSATLTVVRDTKAPSILGVNKLSIYQGSTISYRRGILLSDDYDQAPVLTIDSSRVDLSTPGTYEVIYTATDASGNQSSVTTTITIQEKVVSYVPEDQIYAEVDAVISQIITPDMTLKQQVEAVYNWIVSHCRYQDKDPMGKSDRLQSAYIMLTKGRGNCFNYYALCSVFFDRLNLPQLALERSAVNDRGTSHHWNMVSLDGGKTWYHVDTCPMPYSLARICLSTDAQLEYVTSRVPGYYTMDEGRYPATPKNPPQ